MEIEFFDIPVYRISEKRYYLDRDEHIKKKMYSDPQKVEFFNKNLEHKNMFKNHLNKQFGGMWKYNEIIGFIRLYYLGTQIRGYYYQTPQKRIKKTRKKIFEYKADKLSPEIEVAPTKTNSEIFDLIIKYLELCKKELPKRYIDDVDFKRIGAYVDWRSFFVNEKNNKL